MSSRRCAFIDIGTNTILCLIAECYEEGKFHILEDLAEITRLGHGVDRTRRISDESAERSSAVLKRCLAKCRGLNVTQITAVGTSALRDAINSGEVRERWRRDLELNVSVISGQEEAAYSFLAAREGLPLSGKELLVIDIGGGSTEFIRGNAAGVSRSVSIDVGTLRLTERFLHSDPVTQAECAATKAAIEQALDALEGYDLFAMPGLTLVGIAATFTTLVAVGKGLAQYSQSEVHGRLLYLEEVKRQITLYRGMTLVQRRAIPGLHPMRADVILAGAYLIERIMRRFTTNEIIVSDQGVRYGLLYKMLEREKSIDING
jgi:exopolyphosphatase / guanosine-5'-triphosphate,3'-diphosphate pyrophosphatase